MKLEQYPVHEGNGCHERLVRWACLVLVLAATVFHIALPIEEDQRSSFACAEQGEYLSTAFPATITDSYHLRGIGHKLLNYVIYKALKAVIGCDDKLHFEVGVKVFTAFFYLFISALSVWLARLYLRSKHVAPLVCWALVSAALLTTTPQVHFQAEEISVVLVMLGLGMSLNPSRIVQLLAGLPLALTFSMKGITLALGCLAIVARFAIEPRDWRAVLRLTGSFIICSGFVIVTTWLLFPQELRDLRDTALIEDAQFTITDRVMNTWRAVRRGFVEMPMVISGLIATIPVFLHYVSGKKFRPALGLAILWMAPLVPALVQGKGFIYHLAGFLVPALISVIALHSIVRRGGLAWPWQLGTACIPVFICFLFTGPLPLFGGFNYWHVFQRAQSERTLFSSWNKTFDLPAQPEILYLTAGDVAYYLHAKSHLRYFVPVSIQRISRNPKLREMARFQEDLASAMSYRGKFIVLDEVWFKDTFVQLPELRHKIDSEYRRVAYHEPWAIYERQGESIQ